jgi:hypothetical protein
MLAMVVQMSRPNEVKAYSYTTIYLEVGEQYVLNVTSNKPILDAYGDSDKAIAPASWNSSDLTKRTKLTITAKSSGTATYYICKDGKSEEAYRVRTIKVHVYAKASSTTLNLTNSTSYTDNSNVNKSIFIYTTRTSNCSTSQTNPFPTSVSADTSGKAKAASNTWTVGNQEIATVSASGVVTGKKQGSTTITCQRSWTTSTGAKKTISRKINVYVYTLPSLSVYEGSNVIYSKALYTTQTAALTYKLVDIQSADTINTANCVSADSNKFTVTNKNGSFVITPKTITNGTYVNAIFTVVLNSAVATHNGSSAATFTKAIPISIFNDPNVYVTELQFTTSEASIIIGDTKQYIPIIIPSNASNKDVIYKSSDANIATVDNQGNVTAISCGKARITATSSQVESVSDSYTVVVYEKACKINNIENTGTGIKLEWDAISDAERYQIYRCTDKNGSYTQIGESTGTIYIDESGEYGTKYFYKIKVVPKAGNSYTSDYSNIVSKTKSLTPPEIKSIKESYGRYQIKLSGNSEYTGYVIYSGVSNRKALVTTTSLTATISLDAGTHYISAKSYITISGKKIYSNYSDVMEVNVSGSGKITTVSPDTKISKKNNPKKTSIKKIKVKKKKVLLKLKKVKKASGYKIKYSTSKKFKKSKTWTKTSKSTKITIKKLKSGKKYYFKVRTYKKVKGKKYYSGYTKVQKVTVR